MDVSTLKEIEFFLGVVGEHTGEKIGVGFEIGAPNREVVQERGRGGPPPGAGSRQTYQSRDGESTDERDSTNHGCWSLVWLGTQSMITLSPRR